MNHAAIAHTPDIRYCYAIAPDRFVFRIQTGRDDLISVRLHSQDKYLPLRFFDSRRVTEMKRVAQDAYHDYYEAEMTFSLVCLRYYFELTDRLGNTVYYANCLFMDSPPEDIERMYDCPQTMREEQMFHMPDWAANKVIYQIFPARFASSQNLPENVWYKVPADAAMDLKGDIRGVIGKLPYIRDLGVDVVYLTPIFHSKSRHKYDTIDYYTIDPSFGTESDLIEMVDKAHDLGMKVVLDGVFNHTSPEFFAFQDVKEKGEESQCRHWYYLNGKPNWSGRFTKPNYKCFSYFGGMPKVNLQNPETADYFIKVALYWLRKAHIDGWRLDVADEIAPNFWRRFRAAVKREFPAALIVGEIWHYAADFLQGDQWDSVMNYPFNNAVVDFVANQALTASQFLNELGFLRGNYHNAVHPVLWNLVGSHDTPRILHRCGEDKRKQRLVAALQLLLPGMPMIYYGDEAGMTGGKDPDCRRGMVWEPRYRDDTMTDWYKALIRVRKTHPCLLEGQLTQRADDEHGVVIMERQNDAERLVLLFHGKDGHADLPLYRDRIDLLTGKAFSGALGPYGAAVIKM
jgi:glycosidase